MHAIPEAGFGTVVFDCDSTLSSIEGIEFLAREHAQAIAELTAQAMDGQVPLEEVFGARLDLVQPSAADLAAVGQAYIDTLLPHAHELIAALQALNKRVLIISGGLRPAVLALGIELGLAPDDVHAVEVQFAADGSYSGFDADSPMARAGGKLELLQALHSDLPHSIVLIGDGATDLEAKPACSRFIAYGGVVQREAVFAGADATCNSTDLAALLPLLITDREREQIAQLPDHAPLLTDCGA